MGKWRLVLNCRACGHRWKKTVTNLDVPDPPCPICRKKQKPIGMDFSTGKAPAAVGMSNQVRAIDETARITMETYGMTDLRSDVRQGETMAPKLAPKLQHMADTMFAGGQNRGGMMRGINTARLARQAMGGAFSPKRVGAPDPVAVAQAPREKPPVNILAKYDGQGRRKTP